MLKLKLQEQNARAKKKMLKVVIDTNVLVSSFLSSGPPAIIIDLVRDGKIVLFYTDSILCEYRDVLSRKKFNFSPFQVIHLIHHIVRTGILIRSNESYVKTTDKTDQVFYDAVMGASINYGQVYLVTGNTRHFPVRSFIVTPAKFIDIYNQPSG